MRSRAAVGARSRTRLMQRLERQVVLASSIPLATMLAVSVTSQHSALVRGAAVLSGVFGALCLRRAWTEQEARLLAVCRELELREAQRRADRAHHEERAHDARSVVAAIQGAALAIEEGHDELDRHARAWMVRALAREARRLQHLMDVRPQEPVAPFFVTRLLEPIAGCRRSADVELVVEVPDDLVALGRGHDTARVVANLLDNARRHAPGSAILLRAGLELGNVVVRVEDQGPGVVPSEWDAIFQRGRKGSNGSMDGSGLGLYASRRLMRQQGGDLWVEGRPGGGASFALFLPGFQVDASGGGSHKGERHPLLVESLGGDA
jgi:signal transduction histidine kinase